MRQENIIPDKLIAGLPDHFRNRYLSAQNDSDRRDIIKEYRDVLKESLWGHDKDIANLTGQMEALKTRTAAWEEIQAACESPKLGKLGESCFHKLVEAVNSGEVILPVRYDHESLNDQFKWIPNPDAVIFVVQHDWASAFTQAQDFDGGEFRVPYSDQMFEFRISGRRVCCCIGAEDGIAAGFIFYVETSLGWAMCGYNTIENGDWKLHTDSSEVCAPIFNLIRDQIRAICIALEAEVAVTEIIRAPHKLNRKRERAGKLPIYDHHIVHLARRTRSGPTMLDHEAGTQKRMHFVRGHWRHFEAHKTWIKWHLRGNPDLGFIEKEYRL